MVLRVGIVGGGPRGLSALEQITSAWAASDIGVPLKIELFEPHAHPGAGHVYDLGQSCHNWMNISERLLDLPPRPAFDLCGFSCAGFPSYWDYFKIDLAKHDASEPDTYPKRSKVGRYLSARFNTLAYALGEASILTLHRDRVVEAKPTDSGWDILTDTGKRIGVEELAIAVGHQPTELDEQLADWSARAERSSDVECFSDPFPVSDVRRSVEARPHRIVSMRGFGLSMIDVTKELTEGLGGRYEADGEHPTSLKYVASGSEPETLVPFTLNGLPMAPKPLNAKVDSLYEPSDESIARLAESLERTLAERPRAALKPLLIDEAARITAAIFMRMGDNARSHPLGRSELQKLTHQFLTDPDALSHELIDRRLHAAKAMRGYIEMACGRAPASLNYCLGQVWRHLQPTLYETLSYRLRHAPDHDDVINLDERLKRYAYGPPVASVERLLSLEAAGILDMDLICDPDIELSESGWHLKSDGEERVASLMVNTVLDSPAALALTSKLFNKLIKRRILSPTHEELGVAINEDSRALTPEGTPYDPPVAVLGRLAQGSLIGVDAILECFNKRQEQWAKGLVIRSQSKFSQNNSKHRPEH